MALGIYPRGGEFIGVPSKEAVIHAGDTIMMYGSEDAVERLVKGEMQKGEAVAGRYGQRTGSQSMLLRTSSKVLPYFT